jgi:flagellar biosynthetic protein FliQ
MTGAEVMDIAREAIIVLLKVSGPPMLIGLLVGVIIALFQALTQIQEMTLVFVPKIVASFVTMLVAMPYMASTLGALMERVLGQIAGG